MLFSFTLAIVIICVATALVCGGIILLGSLGEGAVGAAKAKEFYAVGVYYDSQLVAAKKAESERLGGRAGYVMSEEKGFLLTYALYSDKNDAAAVAERLGAETVTVSVARTSFSGDDKDLCAEGIDNLLDVVTETEKMWRRLDGGETSESLVAKTLESYVIALAAQSNASEGVGELCTRARALLAAAAAGGKYPLTSEVKYASAAIAVLLSDYAESARA